jgi:hypothetical protein
VCSSASCLAALDVLYARVSIFCGLYLPVWAHREAHRESFTAEYDSRAQAVYTACNPGQLLGLK